MKENLKVVLANGVSFELEHGDELRKLTQNPLQYNLANFERLTFSEDLTLEQIKTWVSNDFYFTELDIFNPKYKKHLILQRLKSLLGKPEDYMTSVLLGDGYECRKLQLVENNTVLYVFDADMIKELTPVPAN